MQSIFLLLLIVTTVAYAVNWNGRNEASWCDFPPTDVAHIDSKSWECRGLCQRTKRCTHYTWTSYNPDGTGACWLKEGGATKYDAFDKHESDAICGII